MIERGLSCNLKQCCKDFDVDFDEKKLHDALYDIRVNYEVFKKNDMGDRSIMSFTEQFTDYEDCAPPGVKLPEIKIEKKVL